MTPTEKARRSDALYYETVSVNRRVLCDMIANRESDLEDALAEKADLEDAQVVNEHMRLKALAVIGELQEENERLKAENDRLREERDMYRDLVDYMVHPDIPDQLAAENAKLRELCEDMLSCIEIRAAFGRPPTEEMYEMFYKRARELGVDE